MTALLLGLFLFFGMHMVNIVALQWRNQQFARIGEKAWKGLYSVISLAGFGLMIWGWSNTRGDAELWQLPRWSMHLTALLALLAFILITAAYVPRNHFKAALGHPMLAGTKAWALGHLLCNSRPGDVLLFGTFLIWATLAFAILRRRDRAAGKTYPAGSAKGTILTLVIGGGLTAVFALYLHAWLIGVRPY